MVAEEPRCRDPSAARDRGDRPFELVEMRRILLRPRRHRGPCARQRHGRLRAPAVSRPSSAPSGSGKSTLMHCLAGLDSLTSGEVFIGDIALSPLPEKALTLLRRDKVGFIFQAFNLVPALNTLENIKLPMALARRYADQAWVDEESDTVGLKDLLRIAPYEAVRWPATACGRGPCPAAPTSCSPTSPPYSTSAPAPRSCRS